MNKPLVIVGPTASGKSRLAVEVAKLIGDAEIVSADAMAIYTEMSIGTAKPTHADQQGVPHHMIDVASVTTDFKLADYVDGAKAAIADIENRRKVPIVVGGTGLYVRALVDDLEIPPSDMQIRNQLDENYSTEELAELLENKDALAFSRIESNNRRRLLRALEVIEITGKKFSSFGPGLEQYPSTRFVQVGLTIERELLDTRISDRISQQIAEGWLDETQELDKMELSTTASQALGYAELIRHSHGELTLEEAIEETVLRTRRFARRQIRWFRRDPRIEWLEAEAEGLASQAFTHWKNT